MGDSLNDNIRKCKIKPTLGIFIFLFTYSLKIPHIYKKNILASAHPHASFFPLLFPPSISSFQSHVLLFKQTESNLCCHTFGPIHMCRAVYWVMNHQPLTTPQRKWISFLQQTPPSKNFSARDEVTDASTTSMLQFLPVVILYGYWASNYSCCQLVWAATSSHL